MTIEINPNETVPKLFESGQTQEYEMECGQESTIRKKLNSIAFVPWALTLVTAQFFALPFSSLDIVLVDRVGTVHAYKHLHQVLL